MCLLYLMGLQHLKAVAGDRLAVWPIVALGVCLTELNSVEVRTRKVSLGIAMTEIPIALGLVYLGPALVILATAAGYLAAKIRQRRPALKVLTGLSALLFAVSVAAFTYDSLIGRSSPIGPWGWLVAALAITTIMAVSLAVVLVAMWVIDPRWRRPPLRAMLVQVGVCTAVCTAGGVVAISLTWGSLWGAVLFAAILVGINLGYRATVRSSQRYANLEKLYDFTRRLSSLHEARDVMLTVLEEARVLLSASYAEVVIPLAAPLEGVVLRCVIKDDEPPVFEEGVPIPPLGRLLAERGALFLARGSDDGVLKKAIRDHGLREALVAPLQQEDLHAGFLLVADRPYRHDGFSKSDLLFFETLTANAGVALRSSELLEQLRHEAAIRQHQAHHDRLTGLPNRALFNERLQTALDEMSTPDEVVAVLLVDLDSFKDVNDTLGHHTGDAILREIARRLGPFTGEKSLVARMGGDEFAVLLGDARDQAAVQEAAEEVLGVITRPMAVENLLLDIRASLGVAVAPGRGRGRDAVNLVRHADIAMYSAKQAGGGIRFYDPSEDRSTLRRLTLATELRRAMEREELDVFYQPVVHLGTGEVLGCEALLRWNHEQFGPISPNEFIPVAENAGLIDPLTWWVLDKALAQVKEWHQLVPGLSVSVNLSARSLTNRRVSDRVVMALDKAGLHSRSLTLELTESSMMADPGVSQQAMHDLKDLGVKLSIDDYGTGFSSLSRLKELPFRELKIDRSFVKEMIHDQGDEAIVRSTIELARNLGRTVTAEGVEDKATLHRLASLGCTAAQGYYLARPLAAAECTTWLRSFVGWPTNALGSGTADLAVAGPGEDLAAASQHREDQGTTAWQLHN